MWLFLWGCGYGGEKGSCRCIFLMKDFEVFGNWICLCCGFFYWGSNGFYILVWRGMLRFFLVYVRSSVVICNWIIEKVCFFVKLCLCYEIFEVCVF